MGQTTGQTVGMVAGGIIGGIIGGFPGAMVGMSIGGQLGLWIDPPGAPPPPPLGDLGKNSYVKSSPVPICIGQNKCFGGIVWVGELASDYNNEGSRKNPEWSPEMEAEFACVHCEGEVESFTNVYWIDDKRAFEMEDEGYKMSPTSYVGSATQSIDPRISAWQANKSVGAINLKYSAYSSIYLKVKGSILQRLPNIAAEIKGFNTEAGEEDANPIRGLYDFMTNPRWGIGLETALFNGDPDTVGSPWKDEADYCDANVQIIDWDDTPVNEPRFRYSNVFDSRTQAYDIITDILITCRGLVRIKQGKIEPLIEKPTETPDVYYSERHKENYTAGASSTVNKLYADFSAFPTDYWFGDEGIITISGTEYRFLIKYQTDTYIDLFEDLPVSPNTDDSFSIVKDNIKEGSFSFRYNAEFDVANKYRVEYLARKVKDENDNFRNEYSWDIVEKDLEAYHLNLTDPTKLKTVRMGGIKRKSQAMRMLQFFSDLAMYSRNWCEFQTDHQGYYHAVGDLIGVTHSQTGWVRKVFRIIGMEEAENDEVKFTCFEYNANVYSDTIPKVTHIDDNNPPSPYEPPDIIERFYAVQDLTENKIYILFKRPDDNNYFVGAKIYVSVGGGDYIWKKTVGHVTPSVKLDAGIDDSQTTIGYDNTTLYGSFPSSGSFWIEDELITYTGISGDPDYEFTGCTRGSNAAAHTIDKYCMLKEVQTEYIIFEDSEVGQSWTIKGVSVTVYNLVADFATSPTKALTIS
jgi:hypothetical protein